MRRVLLKQLPAFTRFYGMMPWDVEQLTFAELQEYTRQMNEFVKQQQAAARKR